MSVQHHRCWLTGNLTGMKPDPVIVSLLSLASTGADCTPCGQYAADTENTSPPVAMWEGPLVVEGEVTGDGRLINANSLRWPDLPAKLRYVAKDIGFHDGAQVVGHILTLERRDGGLIWGTGTFDLASAAGQEAYRQVDQELTNGVSVDLDDVSFEVRIAAEVFDDMQADDDTEPEPPETDDEGRVTVVRINSGDELIVTTDALLRSATLVAIPAFKDAKIRLTEAGQSLTMPAVTAPIVASGPALPPRDWFTDPQLTELTGVTVDGNRIFGHLAGWNTCHISHTSGGQCIQPPHSTDNYRWFRTGVVTTDGGDVAVGRVTLDTPHAGLTLSAASATAHYENTGSAVADVNVGEDMHGIWVAGALRPGLTDAQIQKLKASPLSGDWRPIGPAKVELVAALAVNVAGFPIPRPAGMVAGGRVRSLVAAGIVVEDDPGLVLTADDVRYLKSEQRAAAAKVEQAATARAAAVKSRVFAFALSRRVARVR